jgi:hypothetical protein
MAVFQSQGTIAKYREVVKALKAGDSLSRETKSKIGCEVEGAVLPFRIGLLPESVGRRELLTGGGN